MENDHWVLPKPQLFNSNLLASYIEAIPINLGIVDVFDLDQSGFDFANKWLTSVFRKSEPNFSILTTDQSTASLEHLFFDARNTERLKGYKNIGFGYPILTKKDRQASKGVVAAPVFIWETTLEPNAIQENNWQLALRQGTLPKLNPILASIIPEMADEIARFEKNRTKKGLTLATCQSFCENLANALGFQNNRPNYSIEKFPDIVELATIEQSGAIFWSGILANFPPLALDFEQSTLLNNNDWQGRVPENNRPYSFSYLLADHYQKAAYQASLAYPLVTIESAPGSGRSHLITNLIIGNLLNGQSTLVVADSVVVLEKLNQLLDVEGFGDHVFRFQNLALDKKNLVDRLGAKISKLQKNRTNKKNDFPAHYLKFQSTEKQLKSGAEAYQKNVFDIHNWTEAIGLFLQSNRLEGKEQLDTHLQIQDFTFDFLEYERLNEVIAKSVKHFNEIFAFPHPLKQISDIHFQLSNEREAKNKLAALLQKMIRRTRKVQKQYLQTVGQYKNALEVFYGQQYETANNCLYKLRQSIGQLTEKFGVEYHKVSVGNLKIRKTFSGKSKTALQLKSAILNQYEHLQKTHDNQPLFDFTFLNSTEAENIDLLETHLGQYEESWANWLNQQPYFIQENVKNLSSKTAFAPLKRATAINDLEAEFAGLIEMLNEHQLFTHTLSNNAMTLQLKAQMVEELLGRLLESQYHLRDFEQFYPWRQLSANWTAQEEKVVNTLMKVQPKDWQKAFDAWYFHHLLVQQSRPSDRLDQLLKQYLQAIEKVRKSTPNFVQVEWHRNGLAALQKIKKRSKATLNALLKEVDTTEQLVAYFQRHLSRIIPFFPVLLMTSDMAKVLFARITEPHFDQFIIKDSTGLTTEEGNAMLKWTRQAQVFGNSSANLPIAVDSFWQLAKSMAGKSVLLKKQHRPYSSLLSFNNTVFEQQQEVQFTSTPTTENLAIQFVDGDYDSARRVNEVECRKMLSVLSDIKGTPQNTFPRVGFVCATVEQRNLLSAYLLKIKQNRANGTEKIQHLERNGMGVYSMDELGGQEFDLLIVSLVFGLTNALEAVTKEVDYFNSESGLNALQQLLNSSRQSTTIFHSLPETFLRAKIQEKSRVGVFILAKLVEYTNFLNTDRPQKAQGLIQQLSKKIQQPKPAENVLFLREVAHHLEAYFEKDRIVKNEIIGSQTYALVIKGAGENSLRYIIQADGIFQKAKHFSYDWQVAANRKIEAQGYQFINIWSKDWWRQPEEAARQLASRIIRADK